MATKRIKSNIDKTVSAANKRLTQFINTEFDKLKKETELGFAEARKQFNIHN